MSAATDPRHGTVAGYNRIPCREECCKAAYRRYRKAWHLERNRGGRRIIPALGAQRRIQALAALGWSNAAVAREAGLSPEYLHRILNYSEIRADTHKRIDAVYQRLSMTLPTLHPQTISYTRNRARRNGWPPPLAYDNIDDPSERPKGVGTTPTDRADVLADIDSWGGNATDACRILGIDRASLQKWAGNHGCSELYRRLAGREAVRPNQYAKGGVA